MVAEKLAQRAAASAEGRRDITARDEEEDGSGSVVHRKPAAPAAVDVRRGDSVTEAAADGEDEGYSTVIFRNPSSNFPSSALDMDGTFSSDSDAAYGTVIVRNPPSVVAAAHASSRPASLEIPATPDSAALDPTFSSSAVSPASSPTSVLVSFAPEATQAFGSPLSSDTPTSALAVEAVLPSSSPFAPHTAASSPASDEGAGTRGDKGRSDSSEEHAAASYAVAFAQNRRNYFNTSKSRAVSDPFGGVVAADPFSTSRRKRLSVSGMMQQGLPLGR